jgi:hypothetical protein
MAITINILNGYTQLSGNRVDIELETDSIPEGSALYRLVVSVKSTDGQLGSENMEPLEISPDANNKAIFNIANLVHKRPRFTFGWPLTGSKAVAYPNWVYQVEIDGGESYIDSNNASQKTRAGIDAPMRIFYGKLPKHEWSILNRQGKSFYSEYIQGCRWLTALPDGQRISPGMPVKLWFFPKTGLSSALNLKVSYILQDGTTGTLSYAVTVTQDQMHEFMVDPATLGLSVQDIKSYQVWLANGDTAIGEIRTFAVDQRYYERNTYVFYVNRFGVIETIWFTGHVKAGYETEAETAEREQAIDDTSKDATILVTHKSGRRFWEINTGNIKTPGDMVAMQDFYDSKNIWIVQDNEVIPVRDETGSKILSDSRNGINRETIVLTEAY